MTYQRFSWTAFTEHDLLASGSGGGSISIGSSFLMGSQPSVTLSVRDDDDRLSGDHGETATDGGQRAYVDGHQIPHRDMYVEKVLSVRGSDGVTYQLAEIEIEGYSAPGKGDDFFSFVGAVPPAGVTLTVIDCVNVTGHGIKYADLSATPPEDGDTPPAPEVCVLTFNELSRGEVVSDQYADLGIHIEAQRSGQSFGQSHNDAMIFDTNSPTGGDWDLSYQGRGNALIISEDNDSHDPDDNLHGGGIRFRFDTPTDIVSLVVLDAEQGGAIYTRVKGGAWERVTIPCDSNNGAQTIQINADDVSEMYVYLCGTGAIDDLKFLKPVALGALTGRYFRDENNDGLDNDGSNNGYSDIRVELLDVAGDPTGATTTTDAAGNYSFTGLVAGTYGVRFVDEKSGQALIAANVGSDDRIDSDAIAINQTTSQISGISVVSGQTTKDNDAGVTCKPCEAPGAKKIDFNGFSAGDVLTNVDDVVTISVQRFTNRHDDTGVTGEAMAFDTEAPTGGDGDLGYNGQGNVLIISEDGDSNDPDDNWAGGIVTFDFAAPSDVFDLKVIDTEEGGSVSLFDADGGLIKTVDLPNLGNAEVAQVLLDASGVSQMVVTLNGSGAIDDICYVPPVMTASLGGRYFMDVNDNDVQDAEDMAVAGATVVLRKDGAVVARTTTDEDGFYLFEGLTPGDGYRVRFIDTGEGKSFVAGNIGDDDTIDSDVVRVGGAGNGNTGRISLAPGEDKRNVDAGIEELATVSLGGRVFVDSNDDDQDDNNGDEAGVGDVTVILLDAAGVEVATQVTGADGSYLFTDLAAGDYRVVFPTDVDGRVLVGQDVGADVSDSDAAQDSGATDLIAVAIGDAIRDVDAGVADPGTASLAGRIFMDGNGNDVDDAEMGVADQLVVLRDEAGAEVARTTTDDSGAYGFSGLAAGDYVVVFPTVTPDGQVLVAQDVGADDTIDSDADQGTGATAPISLAIGDAVTDVDAGVVDPAGSVITGTVFCDENDNAIQDAGDVSVPGVLVNLLDADGAVIASQVTDDAGNYRFTGLSAGSYAVQFPPVVDGKLLVEQDAGADDSVDSDADPVTGVTMPITVGINEVSEDNDAGVADPATASLGGRVFVDSNDDDQDDNNGDEAGVGDVTVILLDAAGVEVATQVTGADGSYLFTDLAAGDYRVVFPTDVDGRVLVGQDVGADVSDSDAAQDSGATDLIAVAIGDAIRDVDAGVADPGTASLAGRIFMDGNGNDVDDAEMGVADQLVVLRDEAGAEVARTTTDDSGAYGFSGLAAGDYVVVFPTVTPDGQVLVAQDVGADDTIDSDADQGTGATAPISLAIGDAVTDVDAGVVDPGTASLAGRFFVDENRDDLEDAADTAVSQATVQLLLAGVVIATTTTNAAGAYLFTDLDAGEYEVRFINPTALSFVTPNVGDDERIDSDATDNGDGTATTGAITLSVGDAITDVDVGVADSGTASIGDTVFVDVNRNGVFDEGDTTVSNAAVRLFDDTGAQIAETVTDDDGNYLFDGLLAGNYSVGFDAVDGFDFTATDAGDDDAIDSDADTGTGQTGLIALGIGENNDTVDAGLTIELPPEAGDDTGGVCALETTTIDVLANDSDPEGDTVTIATVNGVALQVGEQTTLASGAVVTLNADATLDYDSSDAVYDGVPASELPIGTTVVDSFAYTVTDGDGGVGEATVSVDVKGALNTIETIMASLPDAAVVVQRGFAPGLAYASTVDGTGDERFDGVFIEDAYCIERTEKFISGIDVTMDVRAGVASEVDDGIFTNNVVENIDAINWMLNQDFTSQSNGDTTGNGAGQNYTEAEIQHAIWGLSDGDSEFKFPEVANNTYNGTQANVDELLVLAIAEGDGFVASEGDLMTLILDPTEVQAGFSEADDYDQAFIITVAYDDLLQDCVC